eukprot:TRINITY_DN8939_c0_g3_i1.p1 TRINITY_DN8939_c0_g3~~TRINITY_DN8939_c0_g3_i1.p1  ORF type:complete len:1006 (+),score=283.40 TRINITY_DN8939_c0_g3_i1:152-3169(+)
MALSHGPSPRSLHLAANCEVPITPPVERTPEFTTPRSGELTPPVYAEHRLAKPEANGFPGDVSALCPNAIVVHRQQLITFDKSFEARATYIHFATHEVQQMIKPERRTKKEFIGWYESSSVEMLRQVLKNRCFRGAALVSLLCALFCHELFIVLQMSGDVLLDSILGASFVFMTCEFLLQVATDASYFGGFFFWADFIGTFSMVFEISFLLGPESDQPVQYEASENSGQGHWGFLRLERMSRIMRNLVRIIGRLSRVVRVVRQLVVSTTVDTASSANIAYVIRHRLADILTTRIALLTMAVIVMLPVFGDSMYPTADDSMVTWLSHLATDASECEQAMSHDSHSLSHRVGRLNEELQRFSDFYAGSLYGPYDVCYGKNEEGGFNCMRDKLKLEFESPFLAPERLSFAWQMQSGPVLVSFNMALPQRLVAGQIVALIVFCMLVMVAFSAALTQSITLVALAPLERLLMIVRERCAQIFQYADELQEEAPDFEEEERSDSNWDPEQGMSGEFQLLEKVVSKLAAIAHISTEVEEINEDLGEEDIMMLHWMQGTQRNVEEKKQEAASRRQRFGRQDCEGRPARRATFAGGGRKMGSKSSGRPLEIEEVRSTLSVSAGPGGLVKDVDEEIIVSLGTPDFDALSVPEQKKALVCAYTMMTSTCANYVSENLSDRMVLVTFLQQAQMEYPPNPFHNYSHAIDTVYSVAYFMKLISADMFMPDVAQFWLLVAASGHDLGHIAVNNAYLVETQHELALTYNDRSPLENMHCSKLFELLKNPECNVFGCVAKAVYKDMRAGIVDAILHTDIAKHTECIRDLQMLFQMHSEGFEAFKEQEPDESATEVLAGKTQLLANALLHMADVSNPMKPWKLCQVYANLCLDEFFAQGDKEKAAGIPVQMLNDRDKVCRPQSQIGFMEFMILPLVEAVVQVLPQLDGLAKSLSSNMHEWLDKWIEEANPELEQQFKTRGRVEKVARRCAVLARQERAKAARKRLSEEKKHMSTLAGRSRANF